MIINEDGGGAAFVPGQIEVDVQGLDDFAALLRSELDANFAPATHEASAGQATPTPFGRMHLSQDMTVLLLRYGTCLHRARANMSDYLRMSDTLIAAATRIAATYRSADELSAAEAEAIKAELGWALRDAHAVRVSDDRPGRPARGFLE